MGIDPSTVIVSNIIGYILSGVTSLIYGTIEGEKREEVLSTIVDRFDEHHVRTRRSETMDLGGRVSMGQNVKENKRTYGDQQPHTMYTNRTYNG